MQYSGDLNGQAVALVFHYDPALLPVGTDEAQLRMWHYNTMLGEWQSGGIVNTADHTISFVTDSFSPFELGLVPEPSTVTLLVLGIAGLFGFAARAKRRPPTPIESREPRPT